MSVPTRTISSRRALTLLVLLFTSFLAITPAGAGGGDSAATFAAAKQLFEASSYAKALPLFQDAYAQTKSPNARVYIARCLRELGRLPEAYDEMSATVRDATERATKDPKYAPTRDSAAAELALLESQVGKLVVALADSPDGVAVTVNGRPLDKAQIGSVIAVTPGKVTVVATAPGKSAVTRETDVPASQTRTVTVSFTEAVSGGATGGPPPLTGPAAPKDAAKPPSSEGEASFGGVRAAGIVVGVVGVGGMVAFAVTGSMAKSEFDALEVECGGSRCPTGYEDRVSSGRTLTVVADVSLGVGAAALVAGTFMIIFGGGEPEPTVAGDVTPVASGGPEGARLGALIHF